MAIVIIDKLKAVKIYKKKEQPVIIAGCNFHLLFGKINKTSSVVQSGQIIMESDILDFVIPLLSLGDVPTDPYNPANTAIR